MFNLLHEAGTGSDICWHGHVSCNNNFSACGVTSRWAMCPSSRTAARDVHEDVYLCFFDCSRCYISVGCKTELVFLALAGIEYWIFGPHLLNPHTNLDYTLTRRLLAM